MGVKEVYEAAGQGHLFAHWSHLSENEKEQLEGNLASKEPEKLLMQCQKALKFAERNMNQSGNVVELPNSSYESVVDNDVQVNEMYKKLGVDALRKGHVAVILMAGGQGTRLGSSLPKGCYDIGLPSHKSLFQIQAERLQTLQRIAGCERYIPWYIMTSQATREATENFFKEHNNFGLEAEQVKFFNQGILPAFDLEGKHLLLKSRTELIDSPDGNGGLYNALKENRILDELDSRGIRHIHMYCVDNVLVKVADPLFIGYAIHHDFHVATKAVRKLDASESVGLIVSKDNKPCVIEYSEISKEVSERIDEKTGLLKLRAANIVNHYYSVSMLKETLEDWCQIMPFHIAKKKVPFYDPNKDCVVKPTEVNCIKLEQFIFDVFNTVPLNKFGCLEVNRSEEFSPLKNDSGTASDNPEISRRAYLELGTKWLRNIGANISNSTLVEVSSSLSYEGESLDSYVSKTFSNCEYLV